MCSPMPLHQDNDYHFPEMKIKVELQKKVMEDDGLLLMGSYSTFCTTTMAKPKKQSNQGKKVQIVTPSIKKHRSAISYNYEHALRAIFHTAGQISCSSHSGQSYLSTHHQYKGFTQWPKDQVAKIRWQNTSSDGPGTGAGKQSRTR